MSLSKNTCTKYHCSDTDEEFQVERMKLTATAHCFIQAKEGSSWKRWLFILFFCLISEQNNFTMEMKRDVYLTHSI